MVCLQQFLQIFLSRKIQIHLSFIRLFWSAQDCPEHGRLFIDIPFCLLPITKLQLNEIEVIRVKDWILGHTGNADPMMFESILIRKGSSLTWSLENRAMVLLACHLIISFHFHLNIFAKGNSSLLDNAWKFCQFIQIKVFYEGVQILLIFMTKL